MYKAQPASCPVDKPWVSPQNKRECCDFPWYIDSNNSVKCVNKDGTARTFISKQEDLKQLIKCPDGTSAIDPINSISYPSWNKKTMCCSSDGCVPAEQIREYVVPGVYVQSSNINFNSYNTGVFSLSPSFIQYSKKNNYSVYDSIHWILLSFPPHINWQYGSIISVIYPLDVEPTHDNILFIKTLGEYVAEELKQANIPLKDILKKNTNPLPASNNNLSATYDIPWYNWLKETSTQVDDKLNQTTTQIMQLRKIIKEKNMVDSKNEEIATGTNLNNSLIQDIPIEKSKELYLTERLNNDNIIFNKIKSLFVKFENNPSPTQNTQNTQESFITGRTSLLKGLLGTYSDELSNAARSKANLINQKTMQGLVNENIINAKKKIANEKKIKIAEDRLAEINKNYEKEHAAYTEVFKILFTYVFPFNTPCFTNVWHP